jgi:hypothetical protein
LLKPCLKRIRYGKVHRDLVIFTAMLKPIYFLITSLFLFYPLPSSATDACHPPPNPKLPQYIIAYGSLLQAASKKQTDQSSGENKPIWIDHYQRGWFSQGVEPGWSTTYLAVSKNISAHFNGAIFRLATPRAIKKYDQREKYYCRAAVPSALIHPLGESYVDIFLSGCLEIQEKFHLSHFAADCVATTSDWSLHWVNDRIYPRRPFVFTPKALKIDALLTAKIPKIFKAIQLESTHSS